jgi:hypothetical protein
MSGLQQHRQAIPAPIWIHQQDTRRYPTYVPCNREPSILCSVSPLKAICPDNQPYLLYHYVCSACKFRFDTVFDPFDPAMIARKTEDGLHMVSGRLSMEYKKTLSVNLFCRGVGL